MKNKKIFKRVLALICSATLLVGGFSGYAMNSKAADTTTVPEALQDYTKMTPATFGIGEEVIHTLETDGNIWTTYTANNIASFDKKYFDADISSTSYEGLDNRLNYMGDEMFLIYVGWNEFRIYCLKTATLLYQNTLSSLELTAGDYFNLKIATDLSTNASDSTKTDVTLKVWINNEVLKPIGAADNVDSVTHTVDTASLAQQFTVAMTKAGTIKIKEHVDEVVEPDEPVVPNVPEGLEDYTKMTPATFGITEEKVYTFENSNIWDSYVATDITSFDKKYLDADISLTNHEGLENRIAYMGQWNLFIYIGWDEFRIYDTQNGKLLYQELMSKLEDTPTAGEYFNIKIATDVSTNASDDTKTDITLKVWINNEVLLPLSAVSSTDRVTVTVASNQVSQSLGANLEAAGTIKIKEHVDEVVEPENPVVVGDPVYPNVPEALQDYTKMTPATFGIGEEVIHTLETDGNIWITYTANNITSFDKMYFDADISSTSYDGLDNRINYMGDEMFLIYVGWNEFRIYCLKTTTLLYQNTLSSLELAAGDYFNLKIATDLSANASDSTKTDVTLKVWINNEVLKPLDAADNVDSVTQTVNTTDLKQQFTVAMTKAGTIRITEPVEDMVVSYSNISEYRAEKTAPATPEGYLFAGWYTDEACTTAVAADVVEGAAYAKFVDARLLTVKAQVTAGTTAESPETYIRFVTSVNDKAYSQVGFKVSYTKANGTEVTEKPFVDNIVYKQLTALVGDDTWNYTPQGLICADATFFKAQILGPITSADFDTEIKVTPYWETLDGTVVEGTTVTKKVSDSWNK